jgi:hypothetical protein
LDGVGGTEVSDSVDTAGGSLVADGGIEVLVFGWVGPVVNKGVSVDAGAAVDDGFAVWLCVTVSEGAAVTSTAIDS